MKYSVECRDCPYPVAFSCRNHDAAEAVRDRHNALRGHDATVVRHLETPHEGLIA